MAGPMESMKERIFEASSSSSRSPRARATASTSLRGPLQEEPAVRSVAHGPEGRARQPAGRRRGGDERELPPQVGLDVLGDARFGAGLLKCIHDPPNPLGRFARSLSDRHFLERALSLDDPGPDLEDADLRQAAEHLTLGHAALDEPIHRLHAVQKRQDRGARIGEKAGCRRDLLSEYVFTATIATSQAPNVFGSSEASHRDRESLFRRPDLEAAGPQRVQMGAARQQGDGVAGAGENAAVIAPDPACSEDRNPHAASVFHGSPDIIARCTLRFSWPRRGS